MNEKDMTPNRKPQNMCHPSTPTAETVLMPGSRLTVKQRKKVDTGSLKTRTRLQQHVEVLSQTIALPGTGLLKSSIHMYSHKPHRDIDFVRPHLPPLPRTTQQQQDNF